MKTTQPTTAPLAAPAQGETPHKVACRLLNESDPNNVDKWREVNAVEAIITPLVRELNEAKADVLRGIQRDAARLVEDTARAGELATLRQSVARLTEERDQARQDLEERCAENDRERAAHLQAYQEACKERDEARAELASQFLVKAGMGSQLEQAESDLAELRKDRDDAFAYIHSLWLNGQLPAPMTDSLRARIQNWGEPKET